MTIDTIKDVLGRIISINKNLTAESLRNLLTASGWDMHDIDEGLKVFQDFSYSGEKVVSQVPTQIPALIVQKPVDTNTKVDVGEMSKIDVSKNITTNSQNQYDQLKKIDNQLIEKQAQIVSLEPLPPKTYQQNIPSYQSVQPKIVETTPIIITQDTENTKEWGIISLDIILFLIVLGLLLYIIIR